MHSHDDVEGNCFADKIYLCISGNNQVMSSIKKSFAYNSFLMVSNYLINLVLFPYCTRMLGVERFGTINFAQKTRDFLHKLYCKNRHLLSFEKER